MVRNMRAAARVPSSARRSSLSCPWFVLLSLCVVVVCVAADTGEHGEELSVIEVRSMNEIWVCC